MSEVHLEWYLLKCYCNTMSISSSSETGSYTLRAILARFRYKLFRGSTPMLRITHIAYLTLFTGPVGAWQRLRSWSPRTTIANESFESVAYKLFKLVVSKCVYIYEGPRGARTYIVNFVWPPPPPPLPVTCKRCRVRRQFIKIPNFRSPTEHVPPRSSYII